jgi:NAD(P)-dependent dehydrogenase (short-subunit alcohol dehydrogenase family)
MLTKVLAKTLSPKITVNAVAPGFTLTRFWNGMSKKDEKELLTTTLTEKWVTADEIADAFVYLAESDSITGQILIVDGGYTINNR